MSSVSLQSISPGGVNVLRLTDVSSDFIQTLNRKAGGEMRSHDSVLPGSPDGGCVCVPVVVLEADGHVFCSCLPVKLYRHGNLGVQGGVNPDKAFTQLGDLHTQSSVMSP